MQYAHTQRAPMHLILWLTAALMLAFAWFGREQQAVAWVLTGVAILVILLALCFRTLTVEDGGDALQLRYGPIGIWRKRIPYASIGGVAAARSSVLDGWGVHWLPGRGWTWNLWGRDCVEIATARGIVRVGSDDRDALLAFLQNRTEAPDA